MTRYLYLMIVCTILCVCTCEEEITYPLAPVFYPGDQEYGSSFAIKNGSAFESSGNLVDHNTRPTDFFGLNFYTFTDWGARRESIGITELGFVNGFSSVRVEDDNRENGIPIARFITLSDDGDVIEDLYRIDDRQDNWVEITTIDTLEGIVWVSGKYQLHFRLDREKTNPANPDHVRFTDGVFTVWQR